jgi:hypothetical protein
MLLLLNVTSFPLNPKDAPTGRRSHLGGSFNSNVFTKDPAANNGLLELFS